MLKNTGFGVVSVILTKSHEQNPLILKRAQQNCYKFLKNAPNFAGKGLKLKLRYVAT